LSTQPSISTWRNFSCNVRLAGQCNKCSGLLKKCE
jgi:hypothetical protein